MPPAVAPAVVPIVGAPADVVVPAAAAVAGVAPAVVAADVVCGWAGAESPAGFPKSPPVAVPGWVEGAVVAVVPGVVEVAAGLGAPNKLSPDGADAGVDEGAAEEVAPLREGKRDCCGVLVDVAGGADVCVVVPRDGKAGFAAESAPDEGVLNSEDVCPACTPPGAAVPNSGFEIPPLDAAGVVDSAGLSLLTFENRPALGAGVVPNVGVDFCCPADPKRLPDGCCCEALPNNGEVPEAGAVVDGVVDEDVVVKPPKRPPGFCPGCPRSD